MSRRKRPLSAEDAAIWDRVKSTATPLHPDRKPRHVAVSTQTLKPQKQTEQADYRIPKFEIGTRSAPRIADHDLQPGLLQRLDTAPVQMDRKNYTKMRRGKLTPEARIDLHGLTLASAHPRLVRFILDAHAKGARLVLVITGKGREKPDDGPIPTRPGILRHQVPQWLTMPPLGGLVLQIAPAHQSHGGHGAYYVYLRRHR